MQPGDSVAQTPLLHVWGSVEQAPQATVWVWPFMQVPHWLFTQLAPLQAVQVAPPPPQTEVVLPAWQLELLSQQPAHWFVWQLPPQPSGAPGQRPLHCGVQHWLGPGLGRQDEPQGTMGVPQYAGELQLAQATPLAPHTPFVVPGWQALFVSQQPAQPSVGQKLPQPSAAPLHLPAHCGVQQAPPVSQLWPAAQQAPLQQSDVQFAG